MELIRTLAALAEPPAAEHRRLAELLALDESPTPEKYSQLFLFELPAYASIYLGDEGMLGGEARDRIAGFWRSIAGEPPAEPDHLPLLLSLYASLVDADTAVEGGDDRRRHARAAYFWEHLASWLPIYLDKARQVAPTPYDRWSELLLELLRCEAELLGAPPVPPAALTLAAELPDPRHTGGESFLSALTAPIRTGFILTRSDLATVAGRLELAGRQGERRYVLKALLSQDGPRVLGQLAEVAASSSAAYGRLPAALQPVVEHWRRRATASADSLAELAADAARSAESAGF